MRKREIKGLEVGRGWGVRMAGLAITETFLFHSVEKYLSQ